MIDRRLFLPEAWAADRAQRSKTGVPEEVAFAPKPAIAWEMIVSALEAGMSYVFVLADALYGSDTRLRVVLESREQPYVLAVRSNERLMTTEGGVAMQARRRSPLPCPPPLGTALRLVRVPRNRGSTIGCGSACRVCRSRPEIAGC